MTDFVAWLLAGALLVMAVGHALTVAITIREARDEERRSELCRRIQRAKWDCDD